MAANGRISAKQIIGLVDETLLLDQTAQTVLGQKTFVEYDPLGSNGTEVVPTFSNADAAMTAGRFASAQFDVGSGGLFPTVSVLGRLTGQFTTNTDTDMCSMVFIGSSQDLHLVYRQYGLPQNNDAGYLIAAGRQTASTDKQLAESRSSWLKAGLSADYVHIPRFNAVSSAYPHLPADAATNKIYTQDAGVVSTIGTVNPIADPDSKADTRISLPTGYNPLAVTWNNGGTQASDIIMTYEITKSAFHGRGEGQLMEDATTQFFNFAGHEKIFYGDMLMFNVITYTNTTASLTYVDSDILPVLPILGGVDQTTNPPRWEIIAGAEDWDAPAGGLPAASTTVAELWRNRLAADSLSGHLKGYLDYTAASLSNVPMKEVMFSGRVDGRYIHRYTTELALARWTPSSHYADAEASTGIIPDGSFTVGFDEAATTPAVFGTPAEISFDVAHAVQIVTMNLTLSSGTLPTTGYLRCQITEVNPTGEPTNRQEGLLADFIVDFSEAMPSAGQIYMELVGVPVGNTGFVGSNAGGVAGPITKLRNHNGMTLYVRFSSSEDPASWDNPMLTGQYIHYGGEQRAFAASGTIPAAAPDQADPTTA